MRSPRRSLLLFTIAGLAATVALADVAPDRQAVILTRALAYDNNLKSRAGDAVVLAVLWKSGNAASEAAAGQVASAFKALEGVKVQELPFRAMSMPYAGAGGLKSAIADKGIDVLYVCSGLDAELGAIKDVSRSAHVLTMAAREDFLHSGLSLGVFLVDSKNTITVNLPASREEGVAFGSELLRLARIVK